MAKPVVLDTDVLVDFLRGRGKAVAFVNACSDRIILSTVVIAELYAGVREEEEGGLADFIGLFRVAVVTAEIARAGGRYKRDYDKSHGVGLADGILAATVEAENAELATLNTKHFPMLHGVRPAYTK